MTFLFPESAFCRAALSSRRKSLLNQKTALVIFNFLETTITLLNGLQIRALPVLRGNRTEDPRVTAISISESVLPG